MNSATASTILGIVVWISFFTTMAFIAKILSDNRLRRRVLESRVSKDFVQALFAGHTSHDRWQALKWGFVVMALGFGMVLVDMLALDWERPLTYGLLLILMASALLLYYRWTQNQPASKSIQEELPSMEEGSSETE